MWLQHTMFAAPQAAHNPDDQKANHGDAAGDQNFAMKAANSSMLAPFPAMWTPHRVAMSPPTCPTSQ